MRVRNVYGLTQRIACLRQPSVAFVAQHCSTNSEYLRLQAALVHDPIALFETALLLANAPLRSNATPRPPGKVAVAMQSGGNCTMATDALVEAGIAVEPFSRETAKKLEDVLPTFTEPRNPLDVTGQAVYADDIAEPRDLVHCYLATAPIALVECAPEPTAPMS